MLPGMEQQAPADFRPWSVQRSHGGGERDRLDARPPLGLAWADGDTGWALDTSYTQCDAEGW